MIILSGMLALGAFGISYIYFSVPSEDKLETVSNSTDAFGTTAWSVKFQQALPQNFRPFLCAACYPDEIESDVCLKKLASWVSRGIVGSAHEHERHVFDMIARYRVSKVVLFKYSAKRLGKLYFAFGAKIFEKDDIQDVCQSIFQKRCDDLDAKELVDLEIQMIAPQAKGLVNSDLGKARHSKCDSF